MGDWGHRPTQRLRAAESIGRPVGARIAFRNARRPHQALANLTPMAVWRAVTTARLATTADSRSSKDSAGQSGNASN